MSAHFLLENKIVIVQEVKFQIISPYYSEAWYS